jgi:hypothetical protein
LADQNQNQPEDRQRFQSTTKQPTVSHVQSSALTLQQQQQQALVELQAVLTLSPHKLTSSAAVSTAPPLSPQQPPAATDAPRRLAPEAADVHLQRAPPAAPRDDDDSDTEFTQFLSEFDQV